MALEASKWTTKHVKMDVPRLGSNPTWALSLKVGRSKMISPFGIFGGFGGSMGWQPEFITLPVHSSPPPSQIIPVGTAMES